MSRFQLFVAVLCLGAPIATTEVHAWGLGINIGVPFYPRPCYPYPGWGYYYRPYPVLVVYAAPPVVVVPGVAPAVAGPAPVVIRSAPTVGPVPSIAPYSSVVPTSASTAVQANNANSAARIGQLLPQLSSPQEYVRRDTAMDLGRLKATQAINPLVQALSSDTSPSVREAAARALGLIGSSQSLTALIQAAQADADRDVRHSAQFSVEVIRTNLRGN